MSSQEFHYQMDAMQGTVDQASDYARRQFARHLHLGSISINVNVIFGGVTLTFMRDKPLGTIEVNEQ